MQENKNFCLEHLNYPSQKWGLPCFISTLKNTPKFTGDPWNSQFHNPQNYNSRFFGRFHSLYFTVYSLQFTFFSNTQNSKFQPQSWIFHFLWLIFWLLNLLSQTFDWYFSRFYKEYSNFYKDLNRQCKMHKFDVTNMILCRKNAQKVDFGKGVSPII